MILVPSDVWKVEDWIAQPGIDGRFLPSSASGAQFDILTGSIALLEGDAGGDTRSLPTGTAIRSRRHPSLPTEMRTFFYDRDRCGHLEQGFK